MLCIKSLPLPLPLSLSLSLSLSLPPPPSLSLSLLSLLTKHTDSINISPGLALSWRHKATGHYQHFIITGGQTVTNQYLNKSTTIIAWRTRERKRKGYREWQKEEIQKEEERGKEIKIKLLLFMSNRYQQNV